MISLIVAMSQNRVIGRDGQIPWYLSEDLKRFKQITMGHSVIMGRKTFESIGKPLPGRENIVLTRDSHFHHPDVKVIHNLEEVLSASDEIFIIGGAEIYRQTYPRADKIYLTLIDDEFDGDAFFPEVDLEKDFQIIEKSEILYSEKDQLPYQFITAVRKKS